MRDEKKTSNRIRRFIPATLGAVLLLQLVTPRAAYAFVPPSAGTFAAIGENIMRAAPGASAAIAAGGADPTVFAGGGALVALPTESGFATFAVPAIAATAPWAAATIAGSILGGVIGAAIASLYYSPDPNLHQSDVPYRFVPTGPAGTIEIELGTQKTSEDVWAIISTDGDPRGSESYNWGCGFGHTGFVNASAGNCSGTATMFYKAAGVSLGPKSAITYFVAGVESSGIQSGASVTGVRLNTAAPYFYVNTFALTAGQPTCLITNGIGNQLFSNTVNWAGFYGGSITEITPKKLDGTDGLTNTADPAVANRLRQLANPNGERYGGPAYQVAPPTGNTASDPPVIYQDPVTGEVKVSPHGLPVGDDGKPTGQRVGFDPATGQMVAEASSPAPSSAPSSSPSASPSPSPSPSGTPGPADVGNPSYPLGQPDNFIFHLWDLLKTCFPLDWILDFASVTLGPEPHLHYTTFKGVTYNGASMEQDYDLDFLKPWARWAVRIISIGIIVMAIYI